MRILFIGDVYARSGRDAIAKHLPDLKARLKPDVIIANVDNAAHGQGVSISVCEELYGLGVNILTGGNHIWDQREILSYIHRDPNLLRPINYPADTQGKGYILYQLQNGQTILVVHALARLFMDAVDDPFRTVMDVVSDYPMGQKCNAIFVDFHGEATSETMAMGHYLDGKISGMVGTHTHVPTADAHIMEHGSAYQTDAGMTGDYDSVIGVRKDIPIQRFVRKVPGERKMPADGEATFCGTFVETSDKTGLAINISPIRIGGRLSEQIPDF